MSWIHPFPKSTITSRFGTTVRRESAHRGTDYAPKADSLIPAVTTGKITNIYWSDCLGWVCEQNSANSKHIISYCHLSCTKHGINCKGPSRHKDGSNCMKNLKVGDKVTVNKTWVGRCGNTGSCSRGAHLHIVLGLKSRSAVYGSVYDFEKFADSQIEQAKKAKAAQPKIVETKTFEPEVVVTPPEPQEEVKETATIQTPVELPKHTLGQRMGRFWTLWGKR